MSTLIADRPFDCPAADAWVCAGARRQGAASRGEAGKRSTMSGLTQSIREVLKAMANVRGFDRVLEKGEKQQNHHRYKILNVFLVEGSIKATVTVVSSAPGKVVCEMKVEDQHTNKMGTLHGGLTATLVDNISTLALLCTERGAPGVSVDMNITYMSPAKIGEDVVITAHVLKQGKTLAFASVDLTNKATGKLIAQGRHTKHLGN
ncbi:PREDICTED: acyl-coenzyme A thioesterase 13 [Chrysochloris asiatica]|uniref:Acyl-coenzyme A thioesterase 13 n=1 Tax=Chrysochloris asiatica TaxID=185453 RepID=A0A9B0TZF7_CHRAS|nr:PREDICTED: acyl-coenzyme A thioesterase 13 [Chrysochloris asiatica]